MISSTITILASLYEHYGSSIVRFFYNSSTQMKQIVRNGTCHVLVSSINYTQSLVTFWRKNIVPNVIYLFGLFEYFHVHLSQIYTSISNGSQLRSDAEESYQVTFRIWMTSNSKLLVFETTYKVLSRLHIHSDSNTLPLLTIFSSVQDS